MVCIQCLTMIYKHGEAYQVKLLLKLLVCIVDTKLLKAVDVKRFKAEDKGNKDHIRNGHMRDQKHQAAGGEVIVVSALPINVQNTNESMLLSWSLQCIIYPLDNAIKQMGIDLLGEGISGIYSPLYGLRLHHRLGRQNDPPIAQPTRQPFCTHAQQLTEERQVWITGLEDMQIKLCIAPGTSQTKKAFRLSEVRLTGTDDFPSPEFLIWTFPKCKMAAKTLNTSDWKSSFNPG